MIETSVLVVGAGAIGGVVEKDREYGVQTPLNSGVVGLVHAMERGERRPGPDLFGELV